MKGFRDIVISIKIEDIKKIEQLENGGIDIFYIDYDSGEILSCETKDYNSINEFMTHMSNTRIEIKESD